MESVKVKKQIIKDNQFEGYEIREVSPEIVEEQLSLPKEERHSHWRNVELATEEDVKKYGGEEYNPKSKIKKSVLKPTETKPTV